jgi:hypothetical protein
MSAIDEEGGDSPTQVIQVLFALHPNFGAQELCGPLEVLSHALHKLKEPGITLPTVIQRIGKGRAP